ncbi:hypothetical protein [Actinomycetospora sp. NBRC 106378]|uniref:hypothetical protein n=1 Tax=Actinomycetospora sp. NBRC 106378 TaxID=3032208 RepID=UPI00249FCEEA|nr:hypothetical protein [Actinomycetospora sp. NBRC 106378]GLZ55793.1 hypothetical protein Acsp07_54100 [Actinomycetospora sp. NBRC 106378]
MREMITVREADHELRIQVVDARAYVAIVPVGAEIDPEGPGTTVSLPARRLHALLRAAWADDQFGIGGPMDPPLWPAEPPDDDPYAEERLLFGWREDWPEAWDGPDGQVVPFPRRPPRPANGGLPWSAEDDAALRAAWLAADPGTPRTVLLDELADRFARTPGAVTARLYRVGCDPARLGMASMEPVASSLDPEAVP